MEIIERKVSELIPYANNPRHNDSAVDAVAASIKSFGFKVPIIVDKDGVIVAGHTRLKAAQKLGLDRVPCIIADDLTPEQVKAFRLADNKVGELADWDFEKLDLELEELDFDMTPFGFEFDTEEADAERKTREDTVPEAPKTPVTRLGDVWLLGDHRVMCGDSTDAEAVSVLMQGKRADICFTSPPYNVNAGFNGKDFKDGYLTDGGAYDECTDDKSPEEYAAFLSDSLKNALAHCDDVFFNLGYTKGALCGMAMFLGQNAKTFAGAIHWRKSGAFTPVAPVQHGILANVGEPIFIFNNGGMRKLRHPQWDRKKAMPNVIETENATKNEFSDIHGATFPVALPLHFLQSFVSPSGICLDLFGGTGTTLIAAQRTGKLCYMMELSPSYVDVIVERWQKETGDQAILEKTGETFDSLKA